jgi:hypothetical protein
LSDADKNDDDEWRMAMGRGANISRNAKNEQNLKNSEFKII